MEIDVHEAEETRVEALRSLERSLQAIRVRARVLLVLRVLLLGVACTVAAVMVGAIADFVLRSPMAVRAVGLCAALVVGVWGFLRFVWPAVKFNPSLCELALRVERQPLGEGGELRGLLASALELADEERHGHESAEMRAAVIAEALRRWDDGSKVRVFRKRPALRAAGIFGATMVVLMLSVVVQPTLSRIGAERMLMPWTGVDWPKRQWAVDITSTETHAIDTALPMRSAIVRTNRGQGKTPVRVRYRGVVEDQVGPWRTSALTGQDRRVDLSPYGMRQTGSGELYERLLDPMEVLATTGARAEGGWIEYQYLTEDDETLVRRVRVVSPPAIASAMVRIVPPEYALPDAAAAGFAASDSRDLGRGQDERAMVSRVLAGSRVEVTIVSNKVLPPALGGRLADWLEPLRERSQDVTVDHVGKSIVIGATLVESVRLRVELVDEFGLHNRDDAVFSFDVVKDGPPEVVVVEPGFDEQLLAEAVVGLSAEARDDLGLVELSIETMVARRLAGSEGGAPEANGVWRELDRAEGRLGREASAKAQLKVAETGATAGDEVWVSSVARDTLGHAGFSERSEVRSTIRRLRIISETELLEQIRAELSGLRQTAMRLDEQQSRLAQRRSEQGASEALAREQAELTDRISAQRGTVSRLEQRRLRNALADGAIEGLLRDVGAAIGEAASTSDEAARALAEAGEGDRGAGEAEQQRVRDELSNLIRQLDRGEDGWVARRALERVVEEQRALIEETQRTGSRMIGRDRSELSPTERTELDRIADRQRQAARQAAEAIEELSQRSEQLRQADPSQAAAMAEASRQGRQEQVAQQLEEAADNIQQNQTSSARGEQQQALEALERMLDEINNAQRNRNAALLRQLASLLESIESLIVSQEAELERLAEARVQNAEGLDRGMMRLRDNTLAVQVEARDPELSVVGGLLDDAQVAQASAISALRAEPQNLDEAERREHESLSRLREARAEAQKLEEQLEQQEREQIIRELRSAYREQLEQQIVVRDESRPLVGEVLSRRDRATARGLGQRQETIRASLDDLLKGTQGLVDAAMFEFAHRRLDRLTERAASDLASGEVSASTISAQAEAVELLRVLVEVLSDVPSPERDFDEGADGAGGGGSGGGGGSENEPLLPPMAELKLLRSMQAVVALRTRELHDVGGGAEIDDLAEMQDELARQAKSLIERVQQQQQGPSRPREGGSP